MTPARLPIATAPKDGTRVRLYHEKSDDGLVGLFDDVCGHWLMNGCFRVRDADLEPGSIYRATTIPTHWSALLEVSHG